MKCNYGIMVVPKNNPTSVVHFVAYEEEPDEHNYNSLREELNTDQELGLVGQMDEHLLLPATHDAIEFFREFVETKGFKDDC